MPDVVALAGPSGAGKSTLAQALITCLNETEHFPDAVHLPLDAYYRDLGHLSYDERVSVNFDHPDAIEFELFEQHLKSLCAGSPVARPQYDFQHHTRHSEGVSVMPAEVVVIEGVLLPGWSQLDRYCDVLVYIDTDLEQCLKRRILRDGHLRGRSEASVRRSWEQQALPMFMAHGAAAKGRADLVVPGEQSPGEALQQLLVTLAGSDLLPLPGNPGEMGL